MPHGAVGSSYSPQLAASPGVCQPPQLLLLPCTDDCFRGEKARELLVVGEEEGGEVSHACHCSGWSISTGRCEQPGLLVPSARAVALLITGSLTPSPWGAEASTSTPNPDGLENSRRVTPVSVAAAELLAPPTECSWPAVRKPPNTGGGVACAASSPAAAAAAMPVERQAVSEPQAVRKGMASSAAGTTIAEEEGVVPPLPLPL